MNVYVSNTYVFGYRDWDQDDGVLTGRYRGEWRERTAIAGCEDLRLRKGRLDRAVHKAPDPGCTCGIYATHAAHLRTGDPDLVAGLVAASGLVIEGPAGFRAEKVTIVALFAFHSHQILEANYQVPVLDDPFEFMRRTEALIATQRGAGRWGQSENPNESSK